MVEKLERTLREAGDLALTESLNVTAKGRSDFVTSTDLAIDRYLRGALPGLVPGMLREMGFSVVEPER